MSRVWVTRSEPGASVLARALEQAGFEVWVAPVIRIESLATEPPPGRFDAGVVLSTHAAAAAARVVGRLGRVIAIGTSTRDALAAVGVDAGLAPDATSEGVLEAFPGEVGERVLLIAGEGGRDWLGPRLAGRGRDVNIWRVYRRLLLTPAVSPAAIGAIAAGSGDGARQAAKVWFAAGGALTVPVIVPSRRTANDAERAGFVRVHVGTGATPREVIEALRHAGLRRARDA